MKKNINHRRVNENTSSGFSLLEVLLTVGLGSIVILGATHMANEWAKRVFNRQEASYMLQTHRMAQAYIEANFGAIWIHADGFNLDFEDSNGDDDFTNDDIPAATLGRAIMIPLADNGKEFFLKDGSIAMPADYPENSPSGRAVRVYVRNIGVVGGKPTYEILTTAYVPPSAGNNIRPMEEIELRDVAQAIGPQAGIFVSDYTTNNCLNSDMSSIYGSWSISATLLNGANMMGSGDEYCPRLDPSEGLSGYVGIHTRVAYQSAESFDYLYRVTIPDVADANRMQTNLNMNGHDVLQVASMTVDNLRLENAAARLRINGAPGSISLGVDQSIVADTGYINARISNTDAAKTTCRFTGGGASKTLSAGGDTCKVSGGVLTVTGGTGFSGKALTMNSLSAPDATINTGTGNIRQNTVVGTNAEEGMLGVRGDIVSKNNMTAGQLYAENSGFSNNATTTNLSVGRKPSGNISDVDTKKLTALRLEYTNSMTVNKDMAVVADGSGGGAVMVDGNSDLQKKVDATTQLQVLGNLSGCNGASFFYDYTGKKVNQSINNCMNFERRQ